MDQMLFNQLVAKAQAAAPATPAASGLTNAIPFMADLGLFINLKVKSITDGFNGKGTPMKHIVFTLSNGMDVLARMFIFQFELLVKQYTKFPGGTFQVGVTLGWLYNCRNSKGFLDFHYGDLLALDELIKVDYFTKQAKEVCEKLLNLLKTSKEVTAELKGLLDQTGLELPVGTSLTIQQSQELVIFVDNFFKNYNANPEGSAWQAKFCMTAKEQQEAAMIAATAEEQQAL